MRAARNGRNLQLSECGAERIRELTDLRAGIALIRLVERVQRRACIGRVFTSEPTEIQRLMNVRLYTPLFLTSPNLRMLSDTKSTFCTRRRWH